MDISSLRPKATERMLVVGATGTGKTTLCRELLRAYPRVLVIDPKCTYDPEDTRYRMVRNLLSLRVNGRRSHLHYRPSPDSQTVSHYDAVYRWAYQQGNLMVYTDETYLTMHHNQSPDWQRACVTCGRELGIGMIFCTQRPSGVDLRIYTESEHKVCFYLAHDDDRKRMAQEMGKGVMIDPVLAAEAHTGQEMPHAFWRWDSRTRVTRLTMLDLSKQPKEKPNV